VSRLPSVASELRTLVIQLIGDACGLHLGLWHVAMPKGPPP